MKIGIFHWCFDRVGGGEILANYLGKALNAKVYSIIKDKENNPLNFIDLSDKLPLSVKLLRKVRSFDYLTWSAIDVSDFDDFDMVITSGAGTRSLITPENAIHVNYCHSPPRWLYDLWHWRRKQSGTFTQNTILPVASEFFRVWDSSIDKRVDYYVCNSPVIKMRLWKYLKRESVVLYPPIETSKYAFKEYGDYYLFMSELIPEKRPHNAIEACIKANKKLVVLGHGRLEVELKRKYGNNPLIEFKGFVPEDEKLRLLSNCKAVIYPAKAEDFGIVSIEAFASGKPVICSNEGFPPLVVGDQRGVVTDGSVDGIYNGITKHEKHSYNPDDLVRFADSFDFRHFETKLKKYIDVFAEDFHSKMENNIK